MSDIQTRLSSRTTFFVKWINPLFPMAAVLMFSFLLLNGTFAQEFSKEQYQMIVFSVLFGSPLVILYIYFSFRLADTAILNGDHITLRRAQKELTLHLSDIEFFRVHKQISPNYAQLHLRTVSEFGKNIYFVPKSPKSWRPFSVNKDLNELQKRIKAMNS